MGGLMATELRTDSQYRWMMYRRDEYQRGIHPTDAEKAAVDEGKRFAERAHANVWAEDAGLVRRVREFLGANFHWHDRLAKSGTDIEVVEVLMSMVRGDSVLVIAREARTGGYSGSHAAPPPASRSFHQMAMESLGLSYDAATQYVIEYDYRMDRLAAKLDASLAARAAHFADAQTSTSLGDAAPFEYSEDAISGDVEEIAARGVSAAEEAECDAMYEARMTCCGLLSKMYGGDMRTLLACKEQAFQDYQACRGYR